MFERFTERARKVVVLAQEEIRVFDHNYMGTEHFLLGLIREKEGVAARALKASGVDLRQVRGQVESIVGYGEEGTGGQASFTPHSKKLMEMALRGALDLGHNYIGTEHLLLGLVRGQEGVAARILANLEVEPDRVRREVMRMLGTDETRTDRPEQSPSLVEKVSREVLLRKLVRSELEELESFRGYVAPFEVQSGSLAVELEFAYSVPEHKVSEPLDYNELYSNVREVFDAPNPPPVEALILEAAGRIFERFAEVRELTFEVTVRWEPQITVSRTLRR